MPFTVQNLQSLILFWKAFLLMSRKLLFRERNLTAFHFTDATLYLTDVNESYANDAQCISLDADQHAVCREMLSCSSYS